MFKKTPRAVSDIMSSFTNVINELEARIEHDNNQIQQSRNRIAELQSDIAQSESSKNDAISFSTRLKEMLGM